MNSPNIRSILVLKTLELIPPLVSKTLLESSDFRDDYGLQTEAVLEINNMGIQIQRSDLYIAVRKILTSEGTVEVTDTDGQTWELKNLSIEREFPKLILSRNKIQLILPDFAVLSPDVSVRLHYLDETALKVNLPLDTRDIWRSILSERALKDDEFEVFRSEIRETPFGVQQSLHDEIANRNVNISTLVPPSRKYFDRLIGAYDGSVSIGDYAAGTGKKQFTQFDSQNPYDSFLYNLFLSSHSSMTAEINIDRLCDEDIISAFDFLDQHGDRISQLGAIEVGLRILPAQSEIEPFLFRLIEKIRDDDVDGQSSGFNLLSNLFIFVYGELSRNRLLFVEPPFYRQLAALSQAALIQRQLLNSNIDIDQFGKWAFESRAELYYMQSLADMRFEPRWNPDLAIAKQIKNDFFRRIIITAHKYELNIKDNKKLNDLIFRSESGSPKSHTLLSGPLNGEEQPQIPLPPEIAERIRSQLSVKDVEPSSFITFINSGLIFHLDNNYTDLAARALKLTNYQLRNLQDKSQLLSILNGLANVAAITRSQTLADELRIFVQLDRHNSQCKLSLRDATRVCLIASASRADLNDWREFVGDWLTNLAFGNLEDNEVGIVYSDLQCLLHAVPELWITCGRAEAALAAFYSIQNSV